MELLLMFTKSLRSPYTQKTYAKWLRDYQKYCKASRLEDLVSGLNDKALQDAIISYILALEEKGLSYGTKQVALAAVKHFYSMNDINLNWKKIARFLGESKKTVKDRPYTHEEIRQLLSKCDERRRVIIYVLTSTGMRLGAVAELKLKHLERVEDLYKFTVYESTDSEHITYCTPECAKAIDSYLEFRKRFGEKLGPNSMLIRDQFDKRDPIQCAYGKALTPMVIEHIILNLLYDCGMRPRKTESAKYQRKEVMVVHGFRKFFDTNLTRATKDPVMTELLLGHDIGLKGSYFKPDEESKYNTYREGINALTINEENKLRQDLVKTTKERDEYKAKLENDIALLKKRVGVHTDAELRNP